MKFKKGDKVAVLDATLKGIVISVAGDQVTFEEENGFEMSYDKKLLVKIAQDQSELSKYSDINNPLFRDKTRSPVKKRATAKKNKREGVIPPMEVDLHIQHLVKSQKGMQNFDMLSLQIDTAKYKLEFAIRKRIPRVVFIHGVGEGVLQKELEYLFAKYPVRITEACYQKYGLGATEVYIIQNK
jgi:hypothetical protein